MAARCRSLCFPALLCLGAAAEQDPVAPAAEAKATAIEDFAWIAGAWRGEGLGGMCEEIWSEPLAGTMMGSFRHVPDGAVAFYELMVLGQDDDGWSLRVKHFSRDFVGWEPKEKSVRFALESVAPNEAKFAGLTMRRDGDALEVKVLIRKKSGTATWEPFHMTRR